MFKTQKTLYKDEASSMEEFGFIVKRATCLKIINSPLQFACDLITGIVVFVVVLITISFTTIFMADEIHNGRCAKHIVIPEGIKKVYSGKYNYYACSIAESITLPEGLEVIGNDAFEGSLIKVYNLPKSVHTIEGGAFRNSLVEEINLTYVKTINWSAFQNTKIKSAKLLSVENVSFSSFSGCTDLEEVELGESVKIIEDRAFYESGALKSVTFKPNSITSIGVLAFSGCKSLKNIEIPVGTNEIYMRAFENSGLESIVIPEGVTSIGEGSFLNCEQLKSVTIPKSITVITRELFAKCSKLAEIQFLSDITTIGKYAFFRCKSLTKIDIPGRDIILEENVFYESGVQSIRAALKSIPSFTFKSFGSLKKIEIPYISDNEPNEENEDQTVYEIGKSAFERCEELVEISIPNRKVSVGELAFMGCEHLSILSIDIVSVSSRSFDECESLVTINLSNIKELPGYLVANCRRLKTIIFNESITVIPEFFCGNCVALRELTLPKSVTTLQNYAFMESGLRTLRIKGPDGSINFGSNTLPRFCKIVWDYEGI